MRARPSGSSTRRLERRLVPPVVAPRNDLAEQPEGEIRVVPRLAGPQDALGVLEPREQLLPRGRLHRLPDLARRLALEAAQMGQRVAHRRPGRHLGDVGAERIVEVEHHRVAELENADRRERLRDRPDPVGVTRRGVLPGARRRRHPSARAPEDLSVAEDGGARAEGIRCSACAVATSRSSRSASASGG